MEATAASTLGLQPAVATVHPRPIRSSYFSLEATTCATASTSKNFKNESQYSSRSARMPTLYVTRRSHSQSLRRLASTLSKLMTVGRITNKVEQGMVREATVAEAMEATVVADTEAAVAAATVDHRAVEDPLATQALAT
jgi:hypothetical protein